MGEFTNSVCSQKWIMEKNQTTGAGNLREEGEIKVDDEIKESAGPDEIYDESGNKIIVKQVLAFLSDFLFFTLLRRASTLRRKTLCLANLGIQGRRLGISTSCLGTHFSTVWLEGINSYSIAIRR